MSGSSAVPKTRNQFMHNVEREPVFPDRWYRRSTYSSSTTVGTLSGGCVRMNYSSPLRRVLEFLPRRCWVSRSLAPSPLFQAIAIALTVLMGVETMSHAQENGRREETRPDQMADLAAKSLAVVPEFPAPGERTQIRLEIHNRAAFPAARVEVV